MDGLMRALAKKKIQWKEDSDFAVKFAQQKVSKYNTEVTPTTGMLLISAHILDPFQKLGLFWKWDKGMDINPADESSYAPYDLSSDDEEYLIPNNVAEWTPRGSDHAPRLFTALWLYLNSPSESHQNWGQINPNLKDY